LPVSLYSHDLSDALRRRARVFRRLRIAVLTLVVGYFFLPYSVRAWIPVWLPFLAALGLEVNFFVGGYLQTRRGSPLPATPDRGPQLRDLSDLGGAPEWLSEEELLELPAAPAEIDTAELDEARPPYWRYVIEAVVAVAIVAGVLYYASRPHGWNAVSSADQARAEAAFSREATLIAGHPTRITCDTSGEHVGFVQDADGAASVGGNQAYLTPAICDTLYQVAFKHRVQSSPRAGRAIAVLAHESWHLRGVRDEGLANCYGFQSGVQIGVHLGLSESNARRLMREQLATNAPDVRGNAQYLVPPGCHDGGSYDLNPAESGFP
jgi:hypothetical protein